MPAKRPKPAKKSRGASGRTSGSLQEDGRGLRSPFLLDAGGDFVTGRRVPALLWERGVLTSVELSEGGLLDAAGGLTVPGLVCGHVDPVEALFAGFPGPHDASILGRDDVHAAAALCAANAALAGVTTVYVLHRAPLFPGVLDVIADAFRVAGVRAVVSAEIDESAAGGEGARAALQENVRFAALCAERADGMAGAMSGLTHPDGLPVLLGEAVRETRRAEIPFHLVLRGPPESRRRLAEKGALRSGSVAVVAATLDDEERALLRDLEVFPVVTARADIARGSVPPPLRGLARHLVYGGFDGAADVLAERDAFAAACAGLPEAERIAPWRPLANGWSLAASTFDLSFGRWSPGAPADLVVFDAAIPGELTPASVPVHLARIAARNVRHVVIAGRTVVEDGELVRADEHAIRTEAFEAASAAWRRAGRRA